MIVRKSSYHDVRTEEDGKVVSAVCNGRRLMTRLFVRFAKSVSEATERGIIQKGSTTHYFNWNAH